LTNVSQFIDVAMLKEVYHSLNKKSSAGVDGKTWQDYRLELELRLPALLTEFKKGNYVAPSIRRYIFPKEKRGSVHWASLPLRIRYSKRV